jgi:hypothetical protein
MATFIAPSPQTDLVAAMPDRARRVRVQPDERACERALAAIHRDDRAAPLVAFRVDAADCASLETRS